MKNRSNIKKIFSFILVFSLIMSFMVGCGSKKTESAATSKSTSTKKVSFKDGTNRNIELDKPAEKIVVFSPCLNYVCALNAQEKIVGVGTKKSIEAKLVEKLIPNLDKIPDCGGKSKTPNIEQIMSLKPDLVIIPEKAKGNLDVLEKSGLKVFVAKGEDIEGLKDTISNLGIALGKEDKGKQFVKYYDDNISKIKDKVKNVKGEEKLKVYFAGSDILNTCSKNMYQNFIIDVAGGKNVSAELSGSRWVKVSPEQVLKWNPDVIFIPQYSKTTKPEDVLKNEKWKNINAVKNKKVYSFPSNLISWDYPSAQAILGVMWTAKTINPEAFKEMDIEKEADNFFKEFFGKGFKELGGKIN
ncbi:ABC transporter substrate-binding protein [Clostridium sp. MB40-C1]|uniref:ABC transporter substrate-binding protein n=1 Tax=Clostridium sp. MB40-C1 TaxID=3070996 RepID=UPI0027E1B505|nr:ABC transporter substrate-binding protein [Clostridium sp. MB40-C1]WMJ82198.1 ABC transporter substrate-binding protein [Clostridium sp. MB40-C1]